MYIRLWLIFEKAVHDIHVGRLKYCFHISLMTVIHFYE